MRSGVFPDGPNLPQGVGQDSLVRGDKVLEGVDVFALQDVEDMADSEVGGGAVALDSDEDIKPLVRIVGGKIYILPNLIFKAVKLLGSPVHFNQENLIVQNHAPVVKELRVLLLVVIPIGVPMGQPLGSG